MQYMKLGSAGMKVSRICLGSNMMGGYVDEETSAKLVHTFIECGGTFIDTADAYNEGKAEEYIGLALRGHRHQVVLASKVYPATGKGPNDRGTSRKHVMDAVDASLRRLQTDYLDLYSLHYWDADTPLEESLRAMDDLVREGKVRYVGVSNFAAWQVTRCLWLADTMGLDPVRAVQVEYSFVRRGAEAEMFPLCQAHGLAITPYWVLRAGLFTGRYQEGQQPPEGTRFAQRPSFQQMMARDNAFSAAEKLDAVAHQVGQSSATVTLAWALSKPAITAVVAGTSRPEQVQANCAAADVTLPKEALDALDAIGPGVPALTYRPGR